LESCHILEELAVKKGKPEDPSRSRIGAGDLFFPQIECFKHGSPLIMTITDRAVFSSVNTADAKESLSTAHEGSQRQENQAG